MPELFLRVLDGTPISTTPAITDSFDYTSLTAEVAAAARKAAETIRREVLRTIPLVGRHLLAVKEMLHHGQFTAWAQAELGMTARTAQNYMNAARWLEGKPKSLAHLPPTAIYALASPKAPPAIVQGIVEAAEAGALPAAKAIAERLQLERDREHELARELDRVARQHPGKSSSRITGN